MARISRDRLNCRFIAAKLMLGFFRALGLAPFGVEKSSGSKLSKKFTGQDCRSIKFFSSRPGLIYNLCLIGLQIRILFVAIPLAHDIEYPDKTELTTAIEDAESVLGNAVLCLIWLMLGFRQQRTVRLLNSLLSIDGAKFDLDQNNFFESTGCYFFLVFLSNIFVWTVLLLTEQLAYDPLIITWFSVLVPSFVLTWFITQYVFVVKLIEKRLGALNRFLLSKSNASTLESAGRLFLTRNLPIDRSFASMIKTVRCAHANLYEIAMEISDLYSLPILFTIAFACYTFVYDTFYLVVPFVALTEEQTHLMMVNSVLSIACLMLPIAMLSLGVRNIDKEMKNTAHIIRRLLSRSTTSRQDYSELKQFAIELLHRKIQFTACGLFPLDCTLMHSIFSMVATYITILIQFQMENYGNDADQETQNTTITQSATS